MKLVNKFGNNGRIQSNAIRVGQGRFLWRRHNQAAERPYRQREKGPKGARMSWAIGRP